MYSLSHTPELQIQPASRLPAPNRHNHNHGHHRTQQKSG